MTSSQPAAGWYPDPSGGPGQKYWDGSQWSEAVPSTPGPVAPYGGVSYGVDAHGRPLSDKSKLVAGLLQFFLGGFGLGRFYLGYTTIGVLQILTLGGCGFWALIDAVMIITGNVPDSEGRTLRD
jgi:TM2 domain/Protein of unknown function (DUF2510)